jgi:hypothetical protein
MAEPQTYAELQASLLAWLDDSSANVDPAECIGLAERRLTRLLNVLDMEATTTLAVTDASIDLPADFWEARSLTLLGTPKSTTIEPTSVAVLTRQFPSNIAGVPQVYAIQGRSILLGPAPSAAGTATLAYKQTIPSLTDDAPANWLLLKHPDLYLAASLAMAEFRGWNDSRLPLLKSWYDELLTEVNNAGKRARYAGGPLRARTSVSA